MSKLFINPAPKAYVSSKFGKRKIHGKEEFHYGIDLAQLGIVPIYAAADGVAVVRLLKVTSYGNVIFLNHKIEGKEMETVYAHLRESLVKPGQKVKQGEIIGYMGNTDGGTGRSTGQHLHFEVHNGKWVSGRPNAVDPKLWIDKEAKKEVKKEEPKKKVLQLPKTADKWNVYPTNKAPVKANASGSLNPKAFGGLEYEILGNPQKDVYTIKTLHFGKVNIYAAPSTGAKIK